MPRLERASTQPAPKNHAAANTSTSKAEPISQRPSNELPGHLPDITKIDVENLSKKSHGLKGIKSAALVAEVDTGVKSPSGICHLPVRGGVGGETLVVDDDKGISLVT